MKFLATLLLALGLTAPAPAENTGRYVVKVKGALPRLGGNVEARDTRCGVIVVRGTASAKGWGRKASYVEPEVVYTTQGTPNDPLFPSQWGLGTGYGIRLAAAREQALGKGVTVAVIDTGIRRGSDLAGTAFTTGTDIINGDSDPTDDNGHGTHVAGTIAQTTDNALGCAGVAPLATLMAVKVLSASGQGTSVSVASGIRWAADKGARVINLSLGGSASETLRSAIVYALAKGVVVVAAAGNGYGKPVSYPAAYPGVIAVGAIDNTGRRASFSNVGPELALVAPGVNILQQTWNPSRGFVYSTFSGTSMAAPHVAGTCALLLAKQSTLTPAEVKAALTASARKAGTSSEYGAGYLDAEAALLRLGGPGPGPTPQPQPESGTAARVLQLVNQERATAGLAPLARHPALEAAAQGHAADMAARGYFAHTTPEGKTPRQRIAEALYPARTWGENIAWGYPTPEAVMAGWMGSSGHRANILSPSFKEIGVGYSVDASGRPFWVQDFGAR